MTESRSAQQRQELPQSATSAVLKHGFCVVKYLHNSELRLVDESSDDETDFSELAKGTITEFKLKGYSKPALVLGTGVTQQKAIQEAGLFIAAHVTDSDEFEFEGIHVCSDQDTTTDSDETMFDSDQELNSQQRNKVSLVKVEPTSTTMKSTSSTSVMAEACPGTKDKNFNNSFDNHEESDNLSIASSVSDVEVYINGEPASHTLKTDDKWSDVMRLYQN